MTRLISPTLRHALGPALLALLLAVPAAAATSELRILINVDVNPTTGCDVTTVDGVFPGVEQILVTTVETSGTTGQVTGVERRECVDEATDTFGPAIPVSAGGWPVGVGLGLDGSDVVETFVGVSDIGGDNPPPVLRLGVVGDNGMEEDALLVVQPAGNQPILFRLLLVTIPTLSEWGLLVLALLLALLALGRMRRIRRRSTVALLLLVCMGVAAVAWASVRDGLIDDWLGISPLAEDPQADAPLGADLRALFAQTMGGEICFRLDVFLKFNQAPTAVDDDFTVDEDTSNNSFDVLANDSDPENDPLTITGVGTPDQGGTATTDGSTITYTPAPDFKGTETFTYTIDDGNGGTDSATVTVTVNNINDPPDAVDDAFSVDEDSIDNSLDVLANDTDAPDMGETLTITGVGTPDQGGTATTDGSTITYTPAADFAGVETFTYTIDDGNGGMDTATVTVTVNNINDPPTAVDDAFMVDEDSTDNSLDVLANDSDPDNDPLTITGVGTPDQGGTATTDGSTVTYTPAANFVGVETFTYTIGDGNGGSDMATVTVTVANTNMDPPVCGADSAMTDEDTSTAVDVLANDTDPDPGQTATLTVLSVDTTGTAGMVTNNGTDVTYDPNGQFESLGNGEMDTDTFSYTAQDTDGLTCMATVTVTITGVNDAPMVVSEVFDVAAGNFDPAIGNTTLQFANTDTVTTPHRFVSGDVLANDSDPENDTLAITAFDAASVQGGTVSLNLATGEFTYLPPLGFEGTDSFTYTVSDGLASVMGTVTIEVADMVWYLDNDPANDGTGDDGRSSSPFDTIPQFEAQNGGGAADDPEAGDIIFIFQGTSSYDAGDLDGLDLLDQQKLLGEGVDLVVQTLTLVTGNAANQPSVDNTNMGGDAVSVLVIAGNRTGIEIRGLSIDGDDNAIEVTSTGANQVGATISNNTIAGSGSEGIDLNPGSSGAFAVTLANNVFSTASPTGNGIDLTTAGTSGDVEVALNANTDITSSTGAGIVLDNSGGGGKLFITGFSGNTVHGNTAGDGIRILAATFDADPADANFTGDQVSGGNTSVGSSGNPVGGSAMVLTNTAGDLAFGTLDLFTNGMGATGLDVTGTGTLNAGAGTGFEVTSTGGTISSTNGPAVVLDPLTAGLTLSSVSSASSPTTGVSLTNIAGSFSAAAGSITGATGTSFNVNGGTPAVTYNGSITHGGNATRTIEIQSMTGGSASFGGAVSATDGTGIRIANNTGTNTVSFTSTVDLGTGVGTRLTDGDAFTMSGNSAATSVSVPDLDVFTNGVQGVVASGSGTLDMNALSLNTTGNGGRALNLAGIQSLVDVDTATCSNNSDCVTLSSLAASSNTTFAGVGLTCTGGTCFNASGARTVVVTGGGNTIAATNAVGLNMTNTTIGAANATFQSISASGAANGIVLSATGSTGAFEVTGTGTTDATGGTIQSTTGDAVTANNVHGGFTLRNMVLGDATATLGQAKDATNNLGGDGIDLVGVDDVVLVNMRIARTNNHGIDGTDVTNFAISDSEIFNAGDNNGDSGISFEGVGSNNLDGTATVTNTIVDGAVEFGMRVQNSSGTLGLTISGSQFSGTANTAALMFGEDGLQIEVLGTAQTTALIHNSSIFSMLESDGIMGTTSENGAAVLNITIDGNTFTGFDNGAPNMRSDNAIELNATGGTSAANSPDLRYTISGNTINSSSNSAILIGANNFTNVDGIITGNVINGSKFGFGIEAPLSADDNSVARLLVTGNTITNHNQQGAFFNANNSGDLDITFTGNMVTTQPTDTTAFENVLFQITSGTLCVEASGNTIALGGADAFGAGVAADALGMIRGGGTAQLEVGSANLADTPSTVLTTNNPAAASVFAGGTISVVANGTCVAPIATPVP